MKLHLAKISQKSQFPRQKCRQFALPPCDLVGVATVLVVDLLFLVARQDADADIAAAVFGAILNGIGAHQCSLPFPSRKRMISCRCRRYFQRPDNCCFSFFPPVLSSLLAMLLSLYSVPDARQLLCLLPPALRLLAISALNVESLPPLPLLLSAGD